MNKEQESSLVMYADDIINIFRSNLLEAKQLMSYYDCAMLEIETKLKVLNTQFQLQKNYNPIETIKTRLKTPESIFEKMHRRNYELCLETLEKEMNDIAGVRVICPFIEDIYTISECLLAQDDIVLIKKKDYILNPKENGYRGLHLIVEVPIFLQNEKKLMKVEIQLRTIAMDFWASLEHRLRYKKDIYISEDKILAQELKECAEASNMLDVRMGNIKHMISNNEN